MVIEGRGHKALVVKSQLWEAEGGRLGLVLSGCWRRQL
jgi:hypothetical protein